MPSNVGFAALSCLKHLCIRIRALTLSCFARQGAIKRPATSSDAQPLGLVDLPADTLALVFRLLSQESRRGLSTLSSHLRQVSLSHEVGLVFFKLCPFQIDKLLCLRLGPEWNKGVVRYSPNCWR